MKLLLEASPVEPGIQIRFDGVDTRANQEALAAGLQLFGDLLIDRYEVPTLASIVDELSAA